VPEDDPKISRDASNNPLADQLRITLSVPDTIEIKMVDARVLEDYEIWFFVSSLLFAAVIGFGVPTVQSCESAAKIDKSLCAMTAVWLVLFVVCVFVAFKKRYILKSKSRVIPFSAPKS
jgi:hypothetical protein